MFSILTNAWWVRPAVYAFVIVAWSAGCWMKGAEHVQHNWDFETMKQTAFAATVHEGQVEAAAKIEVQYVDRVRIVHDAGKTIIKEVPVYVSKEDDAHCAINTGFVSLWNNANSQNTASAPADMDQHARSPVALSDIGAEHAREAETAISNEERLIADEDYIRNVCLPNLPK